MMATTITINMEIVMSEIVMSSRTLTLTPKKGFFVGAKIPYYLTVMT